VRWGEEKITLEKWRVVERGAGRSDFIWQEKEARRELYLLHTKQGIFRELEVGWEKEHKRSRENAGERSLRHSRGP